MDAVIKAMDTYIDSGIGRSVIPVLAKLDSLEAKVDAYAGVVDTYASIKSEQVARKRWLIDKPLTVVATGVTTFGTTIGALKVLGYL